MPSSTTAAFVQTNWEVHVIKIRSRYYMELPVLLLAVGCGAIPDIAAQTARDQAKAIVEQQVSEIMAELTDGILSQVDLASMLAGQTPSE